MVLFMFMASLIVSGKFKPAATDSENFIEFVRIKSDDDVQVRQRQVPKKPPPPKEPPPMQKLNVASEAKPMTPDLNMALPDLDLPIGKGSGPYLGGAGGGTADSSTVPLVRIEPQYPRKAAMAGTEGWVLLKFDINEQGSVANVEVIDAQPRRTFDREARNALLKWKYKPRLVDGKPTVQVGNQVKIEFKLQ